MLAAAARARFLGASAPGSSAGRADARVAQVAAERSLALALAHRCREARLYEAFFPGGRALSAASPEDDGDAAAAAAGEAGRFDGSDLWAADAGGGEGAAATAEHAAAEQALARRYLPSHQPQMPRPIGLDSRG